MVIVASECELLQAVLAIEPRRRLPHVLHRSKQQANENANDRNDDEQLDEREGLSISRYHER